MEACNEWRGRIPENDGLTSSFQLSPIEGPLGPRKTHETTIYIHPSETHRGIAEYALKKKKRKKNTRVLWCEDTVAAGLLRNGLRCGMVGVGLANEPRRYG